MNEYLRRLIYISLRIVVMITILFSSVGCAASNSSTRFHKKKVTKQIKPKKTQHKKIKKADTLEIKTYTDEPDTTEEDADDIPMEVNPIDKTSFVKRLEESNANNSVAVTPREKVLLEVIKYLDTPYKYGGTGGDGMDCSAFTMSVFKNSLELELPRSSREQYQVGDKISKDELKFGDLVFFNTRRRSRPGHVGIYIGENQFVHASRKLGVVVSSLDEEYYRKRYVGARRIEDITSE